MKVEMDREKLIEQLENEAIATDKGYVEIPLFMFSEIIALLKDQPEIVRCKDCKHRPMQTEPPKTYGFSIEFPEGSKCPCQCDDGFYSWYPNDDWYCADGEQKEGR